jgi:adenosylcobinamide-GDP ribazoletransferase
VKTLYPFLVALQFLTRLPVRLPVIPDARTVGHSLTYYPFVGLMLGLMLAALHTLLSDHAAMLRAALVLTAWVALTGALHLDGLADSADAWVGSHGDRARTLALMKDPHCGPAAVVTLVLTLLVKFASLSSLAADDFLSLLLIPMFARSAIVLLFATTPYVRQGGLGTALAANQSHQLNITLVGLLFAVTLLIAPERLWLLLALGIFFLILRGAMMRRLGGTTGDTVGALVEITETAMLVTAALM